MGMTPEKKVNGRKRHILVDTNGLLLRVLVHPADITESEGAEWLLGQHQHRFPRLQTVRADQGYKGWLLEWAKRYTNLAIEIIEKPAGQRGFAVIPKRWVVERTLAWLGRNRQSSLRMAGPRPVEKVPLRCSAVLSEECNPQTDTLAIVGPTRHSRPSRSTVADRCGRGLHATAPATNARRPSLPDNGLRTYDQNRRSQLA